MRDVFNSQIQLTYTTGNHTFKFGTDINRVRDIDDNLFTGAGSYTYSNINDFIVDYTNWVTNDSLRNQAIANFNANNATTNLTGRCATAACGAQCRSNSIRRQVLHQQLSLRVSVSRVLN